MILLCNYNKECTVRNSKQKAFFNFKNIQVIDKDLRFKLRILLNCCWQKCFRAKNGVADLFYMGNKNYHFKYESVIDEPIVFKIGIY